VRLLRCRFWCSVCLSTQVELPIRNTTNQNASELRKCDQTFLSKLTIRDLPANLVRRWGSRRPICERCAMSGGPPKARFWDTLARRALGECVACFALIAGPCSLPTRQGRLFTREVIYRDFRACVTAPLAKPVLSGGSQAALRSPSGLLFGSGLLLGCAVKHPGLKHDDAQGL